MHQSILQEYKADIEAKQYSDYRIFDSTRGVFTEGGPAFSGSGIMKKGHIQICIRNLNCINGLFIPRDETLFPDIS